MQLKQILRRTILIGLLSGCVLFANESCTSQVPKRKKPNKIPKKGKRIPCPIKDC